MEQKQSITSTRCFAFVSVSGLGVPWHRFRVVALLLPRGLFVSSHGPMHIYVFLLDAFKSRSGTYQRLNPAGHPFL